jgi:hypothetical protein
LLSALSVDAGSSVSLTKVKEVARILQDLGFIDFGIRENRLGVKRLKELLPALRYSSR